MREGRIRDESSSRCLMDARGADSRLSRCESGYERWRGGGEEAEAVVRVMAVVELEAEAVADGLRQQG